jgi:hypothetical protein
VPRTRRRRGGRESRNPAFVPAPLPWWFLLSRIAETGPMPSKAKPGNACSYDGYVTKVFKSIVEPLQSSATVNLIISFARIG